MGPAEMGGNVAHRTGSGPGGRALAIWAGLSPSLEPQHYLMFNEVPGQQAFTILVPSREVAQLGRPGPEQVSFGQGN